MENKYEKLIEMLPELAGGKENIESITHCVTRIRMLIKDKSKVDVDAMKKLPGSLGAVWAGDQLQVVIGAAVDDVYSAICKNLGIAEEAKIDENLDAPKKFSFASALDAIVAIVMPLFPMFIAGGVLRGLLTLAVNLKLIANTSTTYQLLYGLAWGFTALFPVVVAGNAAKKFKATEAISLGLAAAMVYSGVTTALATEGGATLFGIPVRNVSYASTIFPIIFTVAFQGFFEKQIKKVVKNKNVLSILLPILSLVVSGTLMFTVFGPVGGFIGQALADFYNLLLNTSPILCGAFVGLFWQVLIMFGVHTTFVPVIVTEMTTLGISTFCAFYSASSWCQYAAPLGVALKTKNKELRAQCISLALTGVVGTAVEPCLYGVNLRFKKPFIFAIIGGCIGGAIAGALGAYCSGGSYFGIYTWALYIESGLWKMLLSVGIACLFTIVMTYLFGYDDSMLDENK